LANLRTGEFSETEHMDDQGPALQQVAAGETEGSDDSTVFAIIFLEPGVNVQAHVEAVKNELSQPREVETEEANKAWNDQ